MRSIGPLALALATAAAAGCASASLLPEADRRPMAQRWEGRVVFLRSSLNVMPFFADPTRLLVSPYFPDSIHLVDDASGRPVSPGAVEGVLPLGTAVRVDRIEHATSLAMVRRAPGSPRECPWVYLAVAENRRERPYVAVLRRGLLTPEDFSAALNELFSDEDPTLWMQAAPETRRAVELKRLLAGMDRESVAQAWGPPATRRQEQEVGAVLEIWTWPLGARSASFKGGKLASSAPPLQADLP